MNLTIMENLILEMRHIEIGSREQFAPKSEKSGKMLSLWRDA